MKAILTILIFLFPIVMFSQDNFNAEIFLENALKNYASAKAIAIEVTVNLYEKDLNQKQNTFRCISKKNGNKSYLKIRNTDLITTDSLRLFVDHNNQYMQLQKVNKSNGQLHVNNPADFADQLKTNIKGFIDISTVKRIDSVTVFTNNQEDKSFSSSYYFNNKTQLLEKIVNHYNSVEAPYKKIEMIYTTNLNENNGPIIVSVEDYIAIHNSKMTLTETYKTYEFINQFNDE